MKIYNLTEVAEPVNSSVKSYSGERVYISTGALETDIIDLGSSELVTFENKPSRANQETQIGDVIFAKMQGTNKTLIIGGGEKDYIYSSGFFVLRPNEKLDSKYLYYFLKSKTFHGEKDKLCTGATQKALTLDGLKQIKIFVPSVEDQKQIVEKLDKITELINLKKESIDKTEKLTKSIFLEMFGDPMTNTKGWDITKLKNFGKVVTGNTPSRNNQSNYGNFIEWIKSDNINNSNMIATKSSEYLSEEGKNIGRVVPVGSILVTCIAGSHSCIGNCGIVDRSVTFNQQINAIIPNENVNIYFLYYLFIVAKKIIQDASNNAMKGMISKGKFEEILMILPPISLQNIFASIVKKNEENIEKQKHIFFNLEELYNTSIQQVFNF